MLKTQSEAKYYNTKTVVDGITFDSRTEAHYYKHLKTEQTKGNVTSFELQPELVLIPKFKYDGKHQRAMKYILDFKVEYSDGSIEYIDVKGFGTTEAKNKLKHARYLYPDAKISWISYDRLRAYETGGWIEHDMLRKIKREEEKRKPSNKKKKTVTKKKPVRKMNYPHPR